MRIRLKEVPHESRINVLLRCRLPAVEGAERRVQRFFRVGPEQLAAAGFTESDSSTEHEQERAKLKGEAGRKGLDCNDTRVCWKGDCAVNEGSGSCSGGSGGAWDYGAGDLPGPGSGGGTIPELYPPPTGPTGVPAPKRIPQIKDFNPAVDTVKIDNLPDCDDPQGADNLSDSGITPAAWKDYCESSLPSETQERRIENALDRIEERGEVCAEIAQRTRTYLEDDLIYIDPEAQRAGGHGFEGLVIIWEAYADRFYDGRTKEDGGYERDGSLQSILVHEFDHAMGEKGHLSGTFRTSHVGQCSNITY